MKRFTIAAVVISAAFHAQLSLAMPMPPMATMTIEGTIQKISWHPDKLVKGLPGMSGGAGRDRTIAAHYKLALTDTDVASKGSGFVPFTSGKPVNIKLNHPKDDGFLKSNMKIRIVDLRMQGDEGGVKTSFKKIAFLSEADATLSGGAAEEESGAAGSKTVAAGTPLGGMQLLPGYTHKPLQGIDSKVGEIAGDGGLKISYEIGRVIEPGERPTGGSFRDRPKLAPKDKVRWYREQTINGQPIHVAFCKDKALLVSFPKKGINFRATIQSSEQFSDAMLMIVTYPQSAAADTTEKTAEPSSDAKNLAEVPTTITIDGKKLTLSGEGIHNRMPMIGPRTSTGIYFIIRLTTADGSPLPKGITFDTVHGVQGDKKWETKKFDAPRNSGPSRVEIVARNAPAWTVSSKIDLIVKLRDSQKKEHLLRAAGVGAMQVH